MPAPAIANTSASIQSVEDASAQLQNLMQQLLERKIAGTLPEDLDDYEDAQTLTELASNFVYYHADTFNDTRESKQRTADAKSVMDSKQIGLQNVIYEKRHLLEEIVKCRDFRSVYQDVDLIPVQEFRERAPPEYLKDQDNPHQLMINRLKYELDERLRLKEQEEALQQERLALIRENRKAQEKLDRFDKLLDDFVEAAGPIDDALKEEQMNGMNKY